MRPPGHLPLGTMRMSALLHRRALAGFWTLVACPGLPDQLDAQSHDGRACAATATTLTAPDWHTAARSSQQAPQPGFRLVATVPLPGPANRFDYQSFDAASGRLYINHMNAGHLLVFDPDSRTIIHDVGGLPRATGVLAVPAHHEVYVSAAGAHAVVVLDDRTLKEVARVGDIGFPDGIAFDPATDKVFVSDESGGADVVIDATTHRKRSTIVLGGEAGNTHYDSVSRCMLVAVQTRNELVALDPVSERVMGRYPLARSDHPHGFTLDQVGRLAFISGEGNAELLVLDLRSLQILARHKVGADPDVLDWDSEWRRLYVASESGTLSAFWLDGASLRPLGEYHAPRPHTVAVDPRTHRIYVPLENVDGHPELRILAPR
jgi:DNA-binding beta-propeller fold protein YncE